MPMNLRATVAQSHSSHITAIWASQPPCPVARVGLRGRVWLLVISVVDHKVWALAKIVLLAPLVLRTFPSASIEDVQCP